MKTRNILLSTLLAAAVLAAPFAFAGPGKKGEKAQAPVAQAEGADAPDAKAPRGPRGERGRRPEGEFRPGPGFGHGLGIPGMRGELPRFWTRGNLAERMKLTPEQIAQLDATADATEQALEAVRPELEDAHEALRAEMEKDNPDLATAQKLGEEVHRILGELHKIQLRHRVALKNILTKEQEQQARKAMERIRDRRGGRGPGQGPGAPDQIRHRLGAIDSQEELEALLDERGIDGPKRDRAVRAWRYMRDRGPEGADAPEPPMPPDALDEDEAPMPPLPPRR
jgi:Spy/CpxP family protein refolding chaperone